MKTAKRFGLAVGTLALATVLLLPVTGTFAPAAQAETTFNGGAQNFWNYMGSFMGGWGMMGAFWNNQGNNGQSYQGNYPFYGMMGGWGYQGQTGQPYTPAPESGSVSGSVYGAVYGNQ